MTSRNNTVDIIRGFAMLLVVLGHTVSGCVTEYSDSLLFQTIWTLQMPLFIIISGYVTRYSKPLTDGKSLRRFVKKRSLAYLCPWTVWTILVRGLIFGQHSFLDFKYLLWHMDSGYWFLATIWTISMIYGLADLFSNKLSKNTWSNLALHITFGIVGFAGLAVIGYFAGFDFWAIKLTLYYIPFYLIGYFYGHIQDWLAEKSWSKTVINCVIVLSLGFWLAMINRFDFFAGGDGLAFVAGRFITSMLGCIGVIGLFTNTCEGGQMVLQWSGVHSLEIYLTHYLFLSLVPALGHPRLASAEGMISLVINYLLTLALTVLVIKIAQHNRVLNRLLYMK